MLPPEQQEFSFANDYRLGIGLGAASESAEISTGAILELLEVGDLEAVNINFNPDGLRTHRRILTESLWIWMGRKWRYTLPNKPTFRVDEVADLFAVSARHIRRLCAVESGFRIRRYGPRGQIRILRESIPAFIKTRRITDDMYYTDGDDLSGNRRQNQQGARHAPFPKARRQHRAPRATKGQAPAFAHTLFG